jgi:hypothetical protein
VKRLVGSRLGAAAVAGLLVLAPLAACTAPPPPKPPKVSWAFGKLQFAAPSAGITQGADAKFTYTASGVPKGGHIVLQKGTLSGGAIRWSKVSELQVSPVGSATIVQPPFGRNSFRLAVLDSKGKTLTSASHGLDVYRKFTFSQLTTRPEQTTTFTNGVPFKYVFKAEIFLENTSCGALTSVQLFNRSPRSREFEVTRIVGGKPKSEITVLQANPGFAFSNILYSNKSLLITPGTDLDLRILDNDIYGSNVYGNGTALCLTDSGSFLS